MTELSKQNNMHLHILFKLSEENLMYIVSQTIILSKQQVLLIVNDLEVQQKW